MRVQLALYCASAGSNTFYYAPLIPCYLKGANFVQNQTCLATKYVTLALSGGSTICNGLTAAAAGTATEGTMTTTEAYLKQVISKTTPLSIVVDTTGGTAATTCVVDLDFDEFKATV